MSAVFCIRSSICSRACQCYPQYTQFSSIALVSHEDKHRRLSKMAGPALSFGVELEFLAVHDFASIDGEPDYTIVKRKIYSRMLEAGIPATGYESAGEDLSYVPTYSRWRVEHDSSLLLSPEERDHLGSGWKEELIEISSRKLHLHNDWTSEIAKLLDVLRSIEGENCRFVTNGSTGFHVHMAHANEKIPLRTAKNVLQFLTAFERQIDQIHLLERVSFVDRYNYPLSTYHLWQRPHFTADGSIQGGNRHRSSRKRCNLLRHRSFGVVRRSVRLLQDRCPGARGLHSRRRLRSHS